MFLHVSVEWHCPDPSTLILENGSGRPENRRTEKILIVVKGKNIHKREITLTFTSSKNLNYCVTFTCFFYEIIDFQQY